MARPLRSAARTTFAASQLLLLGAALLGLRSPVEVLLGVVVIGLLLLNTTRRGPGGPAAAPEGEQPPARLREPRVPDQRSAA